MIVENIRPEQYEELLIVWENSVRATHDFITEEDYIKIPENSPATAVGAALRLALGRCKTKGF